MESERLRLGRVETDAVKETSVLEVVVKTVAVVMAAGKMVVVTSQHGQRWRRKVPDVVERR